MCYQKFVQFICGCRSVVGQKCSYAIVVDSPYWRLDACIEYTSDSVILAGACAPDLWYCRKSKDADYIRELIERRRLLAVEGKKLESSIRSLRRTIMQMYDSAEQAKVPEKVRVAHPTFKKLNAQLSILIPQYNAAGNTFTRVHAYVEEVKQFYASYGAPNTSDRVFNRTPSFVDTVGRRIADSVTLNSINASYSGVSGQFPEGDNTVDSPRSAAQQLQPSTNSGNNANQPKGHPLRATRQATPAKRGRKSASPAKFEAHPENATVRRSARISNKNVNYEESDGVSSSRAVSPGESDVSRFSEKTETSESPDRSQKQRKRGRPSLQAQSSGLPSQGTSGYNNTIGSKLSEYRERINCTSSTGSRSGSYGAPALPPNTHQALNTSNPSTAFVFPQDGPWIDRIYGKPTTNATLSPRPPTRYRPPTQPQVGSFGSYGYKQQQPATPNFLPTQSTQPPRPYSSYSPVYNGQDGRASPNLHAPGYGQANVNSMIQQGNSDLLMTTPAQSTVSTAGDPVDRIVSGGNQAMQRIDSATGQTADGGLAAGVGKIAPRPSYGHMRRSFDATVNLTPAASSTPAQSNTDPKKRKQSASSPLQTSNKRPRLSFPGDTQPDSVNQNTPGNSNRASSMSSPSKMQSQISPMGGEQAQDQDDAPPAPAPAFAPTAVMYKPSEQQTRTKETTSAFGTRDEVPGDRTQVQQDAVADGNSDINWDEFMEPDILSEGELPGYGWILDT